MKAKHPDQTLPFRLHLSDTVSLDLPSVAGESTPSQTTLPFLVPNTIQLSLLSSNLSPPPGEAYPSDVLSLTISHRMLPEPPQFRVSLLPTRRRDYPSGIVALVSCHDVDAGLLVGSYACRLHATLIHSMP